MSKECNVMVNGVEYAPLNCDGESVRIVVLQRGWIHVGYYSRDGEECRLRSAQTIRQWGTTTGLGQIAKDGPTSSTKLDPCNGLIEFHRLTEVFSLVCNKEKWSCLDK